MHYPLSHCSIHFFGGVSVPSECHEMGNELDEGTSLDINLVACESGSGVLSTGEILDDIACT